MGGPIMPCETCNDRGYTEHRGATHVCDECGGCGGHVGVRTLGKERDDLRASLAAALARAEAAERERDDLRARWDQLIEERDEARSGYERRGIGLGEAWAEVERVTKERDALDANLKSGQAVCHFDRVACDFRSWTYEGTGASRDDVFDDMARSTAASAFFGLLRDFVLREERDQALEDAEQWRISAVRHAEERDQARAELADHMAGNMQLRTILGARDNETMFCVVERVAAALSKANALIVAYTEACNSVPDMSEDFGGVADEREWACGEIERTQTSLHDHGRALRKGAGDA